MNETLKIIASSWPIAVMVVSAMAGGLALYIVNWRKQSEAEDKAYRSSQAVSVRRND